MSENDSEGNNSSSYTTSSVEESEENEGENSEKSVENSSKGNKNKGEKVKNDEEKVASKKDKIDKNRKKYMLKYKVSNVIEEDKFGEEEFNKTTMRSNSKGSSKNVAGAVIKSSKILSEVLDNNKESSEFELSKRENVALEKDGKVDGDKRLLSEVRIEERENGGENEGGDNLDGSDLVGKDVESEKEDLTVTTAAKPPSTKKISSKNLAPNLKEPRKEAQILSKIELETKINKIEDEFKKNPNRKSLTESSLAALSQRNSNASKMEELSDILESESNKENKGGIESGKELKTETNTSLIKSNKNSNNNSNLTRPKIIKDGKLNVKNLFDTPQNKVKNKIKINLKNLRKNKGTIEIVVVYRKRISKLQVKIDIKIYELVKLICDCFNVDKNDVEITMVFEKINCGYNDSGKVIGNSGLNFLVDISSVNENDGSYLMSSSPKEEAVIYSAFSTPENLNATLSALLKNRKKFYFKISRVLKVENFEQRLHYPMAFNEKVQVKNIINYGEFYRSHLSNFFKKDNILNKQFKIEWDSESNSYVFSFKTSNFAFDFNRFIQSIKISDEKYRSLEHKLVLSKGIKRSEGSFCGIGTSRELGEIEKLMSLPHSTINQKPRTNNIFFNYKDFKREKNNVKMTAEFKHLRQDLMGKASSFVGGINDYDHFITLDAVSKGKKRIFNNKSMSFLDVGNKKKIDALSGLTTDFNNDREKSREDLPIDSNTKQYILNKKQINLSYDSSEIKRHINRYKTLKKLILYNDNNNSLIKNKYIFNEKLKKKAFIV